MNTSGLNMDKIVTDNRLDIINDVLPEVLVITNGVDVADITLHEIVAKHICRRLNSTTKSTWIYGDIQSALRYAYSIGFETGGKKNEEEDKKLCVDKVCPDEQRN